MSLICALSNEVPEEPVISPVSGAIFEKRLVVKYITDNGVDPINSQPVTVDRLIDVKTPPLVKPRPPSVTSIPAILKALQDEWDAVMLHSFQLRQQLQTARQELSHALYQHDAACRVIARLNKELTAAREALATLKPQTGVSVAEPAGPPAHAAAAMEVPSVAPEVEEAPLAPEVITKLQEKATVLTQERKKRGKSIPEDLVPQDILRVFRTLASHPGLHSAGAPGILCLDIHAADTSKIVTGGNDKNAIIFNKETEQVVAVLKGHTKKVTHVVYHPTEDSVITCSPDATIRFWDVGTSQTVHLIRAHHGPVTGLSLHATGDYILSTSSDQHWAFSDIRTGRVLTQVSDATSRVALTAAQFHPDGLIFATGTSDAQIKIWDLKERTNVANFPGHTGEITSISFSENGYYLATAAEDSSVKLWDLRKLKNFKTITLEEPEYKVKDLCFDQSGAYLAVAGTDVRVYLCKQWQELKVFNDHTALATGIRFGRHAQFIASVSMDRTLKLYGK